MGCFKVLLPKAIINSEKQVVRRTKIIFVSDSSSKKKIYEV